MNINSVITYLFSIAALIVSIVSIVQTNKRDKNRKLKNSLMTELSVFYNSLRQFIFCYTEGKQKANPQQIISTLKVHFVQFSAIKSIIQEEISCHIQDLDTIDSKFQDMRRIMTDAVEFIEAVSNKTDFVFSDITIKEIEELNADIYKSIMRSQYKINSSVVKRK